MKVLIIGGKRFVGLRLSQLLQRRPEIELHIFNRSAHPSSLLPGSHVRLHRGDRSSILHSDLERNWDIVFDFACFNQKDAECSVEFFEAIGLYVLISSISVYNPGQCLREEAFQPEFLDLNTRDLCLDYQSGKQRAEAVFFQQAQYPVLGVRFPFLLGPDDFTDRLPFHVNRIRKGLPIYFPDPRIRISMLHSEDAAHFLGSLTDRPIHGPLNVASDHPLRLSDLVSLIVRMTHKTALITARPTAENASPYGPLVECFVSTERLHQLGIKYRAISDWLPSLVERIVMTCPGT